MTSTGPAPWGSGRRFFETLAAFLAQEFDHCGDLAIVGAADQLAAELLLQHEASADETTQVEDQGRHGHIETRLNFADVETVRSGADQESVDIQSGEVPEFRQASRRKVPVHGSRLADSSTRNN